MRRSISENCLGKVGDDEPAGTISFFPFQQSSVRLVHPNRPQRRGDKDRQDGNGEYDVTARQTFTLDLFSRQQVKNEGQLPKYYVENAHPAIIDRATFQRVQEEMARRSSLRKTSSKTKTEQGKYSGKYALGGLLVCGECGSPYRRVTYMPRGEKRYVWRCINRLEHGKKICKHAPTLEEPEVQAAVTSAMNELFRQQAARQTLADCITAVLAETGDDASLPAVEAKLRTLQAEQLRLFQLAVSAGPENTEYDERIGEVNATITALTARKGELEQEGSMDAEYNNRVRTISNTLEGTDSAITGFDDALVRQLVSSIRVATQGQLVIRFWDGTEIVQSIG